MSSHDVTRITDSLLCQEVLALLKRFKATMAEIADTYGLTSMQVGVLHAIHDGHTTMGRVAQSMHCDASNVTGIIDRLVAMKLVTRQEDPKDRRVKTLALTPQGHEVLRHVTAELPEGLGCSRLDAEERVGLHRALIKLTGESGA